MRADLKCKEKAERRWETDRDCESQGVSREPARESRETDAL